MGAGTIGFGGAGGLGGGAVTRGSTGEADPPPAEGGLGGAPVVPADAPEPEATLERIPTPTEGAAVVPPAAALTAPLDGTFGAAVFGAACVGAAATGAGVVGAAPRAPAEGSTATAAAGGSAAGGSATVGATAVVESDSPSFFRFFGAAFFAFSRSAPTSTCSVVSVALDTAPPLNHSLIVSARPSVTVACGVVTPSTPSREHFSMMSFAEIPMSFAI